jgi:hypothetical protein
MPVWSFTLDCNLKGAYVVLSSAVLPKASQVSRLTCEAGKDP